MNAFKCETPQEFYEMFAKRTVEGISSSAETLLVNAKEFLSRLSFGVDLKNNPIGEDILDLPQQIAMRRRKKVVVCIDEFQQIGEFTETEKFQKILRSHWQEQKDVAYILYGSKKHMMLNIFGEYGSPFYKFGDLMDSLTEKQRSFLCAVSDGVRNYSSVETLSAYRLGTSGNIRIIKGALHKRDLIDETHHQIDIQDPVFKKWIQLVYKKM